MKILGHDIPKDLEKLIKEVEAEFPEKTLRIRPISKASGELGEDVDIEHNYALAMPRVDKYIAIWIKPTLSAPEFVSSLAEELIHHLQAKEGACAVKGVIDWKYGGDENDGEKFWKDVTSKSWDFEARKRVHKLGLHAPTYEMTLDYARSAIETAETTPERYMKGEQFFYFLPIYLLWYWWLDKLGDEHSRSEFQKVMVRFWKIMPDNDRKLLEKIGSDTIGVQRYDLNIIADHLECKIHVTKAGTSGMSLNLD